jgi:hypothetical protein
MDEKSDDGPMFQFNFRMLFENHAFFFKTASLALSIARRPIFHYLLLPMKSDNLEEYILLRDQLAEEKASLESRLYRINEALGSIQNSPASYSEPTSGRPQGRRGRPAAGGVSLKSLVLEVLSSGGKTKEEVLKAVQQRGYRFSTSNPLNSLGVILYGKNPKFARNAGRFSLTGSIGKSESLLGELSRGKSNRRKMSAAGRRRIAKAAKARWAAAKAAGKSHL